MYESNRIKSAFLKYAPLIMGLLVLSSLFQIANDVSSQIEDIIVISIFSIVLFVVYFTISSKIKNVNIGRTKLIVFGEGKQENYNWLDVKEIRLNRFTGLYKLILKDKPTMYFAAYGSVFWLLGDDSDMGQIISKMKRELDI